MSAISTWSTTAASNNSATPNGWPEGMAPSAVNDCAREMMAQLRSTQIPLQVVTFETGAVASGTGIIPTDDTIPQSTEGTQFMSATITPKSATSLLVIDVVWNGVAATSGGNISVALLQDATANALAAVTQTNSGDLKNFILRHVMTAGTTSATTFKVRAGMSSAGTTVFNGAAAGTRIFGGVYASSIVITEYLV